MPGEGRTTSNTPAVTAIKIGYARVSTDGQDLTAQRQALAALGVQPDRVYGITGITGTHRQRPGLREALAACRPGGTLVVTKLDRLARSVPDARDIVDELTARGVRLDRGGSVHDPADPVGELLFTVLSMITARRIPGCSSRACASSRSGWTRPSRRHLGPRVPWPRPLLLCGPIRQPT